MKAQILYITFLLLWQSAASLATACRSSLEVDIEAGQTVITFWNNDPQHARCEASLQFSNSSFLPILYTFPSLKCSGPQLAKFTVPEASPNGETDIIWQCAGQTPQCFHGNISGGTADMEMALHQDGDVGCIEESLSTASSVVTQTTGTVTSTRTLTSTVTVRSTSFLTTSSTAQESRLPSTPEPLPTTTTPDNWSNTVAPSEGWGNKLQPSSTPALPIKATSDGPFINSATKLSVPISTQTVTIATALTLIGAYCSS